MSAVTCGRSMEPDGWASCCADMSPAVAAFLLGFLAALVILRLGRNKPLSVWERRVLRPLGWALMGALLAFAVALLAWGVLQSGNG